MFLLLYDTWLSWLPLCKIASSNMFVFSFKIKYLGLFVHKNSTTFLFNPEIPQRSKMLLFLTLLDNLNCYRPHIKIQLFHKPIENFISKLTLFCLLSKCSNRGIQTTLGECMPHLSRDMFWSLCLFLHMKGNGYLLKCQSYEKWYQMDAIEPKVLCSRVCTFYDFNKNTYKERILAEVNRFLLRKKFHLNEMRQIVTKRSKCYLSKVKFLMESHFHSYTSTIMTQISKFKWIENTGHF